MSFIASFLIVIQITLCVSNTSWHLPVYALQMKVIQLLQAVQCEIGISTCLLLDNALSPCLQPIFADEFKINLPKCNNEAKTSSDLGK